LGEFFFFAQYAKAFADDHRSSSIKMLRLAGEFESE
jgi:hypothetical protein